MTRRPFVILAGIELVLLIATAVSGFWEGGVNIVGEKHTFSAVVGRGVLELEVHDNLSPALLMHPIRKSKIYSFGNAVAVNQSAPGYQERWRWAPQFYSRSSILRLKLTGVIVPLWLIALVPLAILAGPAWSRLTSKRKPE